MNPFSYLRDKLDNIKPSYHIKSEEEIMRQRENELEQLRETALYKTTSGWGFLGYFLFSLGFVGIVLGLMLIFAPQYLSSLTSMVRLAAILTFPVLCELGLALQLIGAVFVIAGKVECINDRVDASMCYQDALLEKLILQNDLLIDEIRQISIGTPLEGKHSNKATSDNQFS